MAWTKITPENYKEVEYLLEHEFPIMFACKLADNKGFHYGFVHNFASDPFTMALVGCFYFFAIPKPDM